jgi:hypothetical protein
LSLPARLGRAGLAGLSTPAFTEAETGTLLASADALRGQMRAVDLRIGASRRGALS